MRIVASLVMCIVAGAAVEAQRGNPPPPPAPRAAAPIDLTGYWVSLVTANWRWRMVTPAKGDYQGMQLTAEARKVADTWDPAKDEAAGEQCKSYGAPALMSVPGRLHITWQDDATLKVETDTARQNCDRHLICFRGAEAKDHMRGRLFQRLEQCIEGRIREHMNFVDDIDAVRAFERHELDVLADFTDIVHAGIGGAVNLDYIDGCPLSNLLTIDAGCAGRSGRPLLAVKRLRKNPCDGGFPDTTRAGKQVRVGNALGRDGIDERLHDMRLADHIVEGPGTVFSGRNLVIHRKCSVQRGHSERKPRISGAR